MTRKLGRPHEWFTRFIAYESYEYCARCNYPKNDAPRFCLSDAELAERAAWKQHAERAAELMRRKSWP